MCVYCVYLLCIYTVNTHPCMYIFKKNMLHLYIKYIIYNINYMKYKYIHVNIFKIYTVCVYLYTVMAKNIGTLGKYGQKEGCEN